MTDVDESGDWLERWASDVHASAERAATLSRRVAALVGRASSADGSIRVTVNSSGHLSTLDLDDRATDLRGDELSRRILAVIRQARHDLAAQVPTEVGTGTATSRAAIRSFAKRFPA